MFRSLALASTLIGLSLAENDWNTACVTGKCSYETQDGTTGAWWAMDIAGPSAALSDITPAAGWSISGCDAGWDSGVANVQLSCDGSPETTALCTHLFEGGSAANKIVRLTEDCGTGGFARVVSTTEIDATHFNVSLDYNFGEASETARGVSFSFSAANVKDSTAGTALRARRNLPTRAYPIALVPRFEFGDTINAPPINFNQTFPLFNQSFECPAADGGVGFSANVQLSANVVLDAQVAFGVEIQGDIFPPKINTFQITSTLSGSASATFDLIAGGTGSFDSGAIPLFQLGLPGFSVPGVLNLGPQFEVSTQLVATLGLQAVVRAGATYEFPQIQLAFPQNSGPSSAHVKPLPDALTLSLAPQVSADASVTAHLIPKVSFGAEVLGGLFETEIFLQLDGSATLTVNAQANAVLATGQNTDTGVSACVKIGAGIAVTAGAVGAIPPLIDEEVSFDIFRRDFELFQRCVGELARRSIKARNLRRGSVSPALGKRQLGQLVCPNPGEGGILTNILNLVRG